MFWVRVKEWTAFGQVQLFISLKFTLNEWQLCVAKQL